MATLLERGLCSSRIMILATNCGSGCFQVFAVTHASSIQCHEVVDVTEPHNVHICCQIACVTFQASKVLICHFFHRCSVVVTVAKGT